jgi:hypothetical protein
MKETIGIPGIVVRIILKCILKKQDTRMWTGFIWSQIGTPDRIWRTRK